MEAFESFLINSLKTYGATIAWIVVLFFFGKFILKKVVRRMVRLTGHLGRTVDKDKSNLETRAKTLGTVLVATGNVIIYTIILLMILDLFGVDIRPILAGAGIVGLAVGFGAQSLVKDFVSGLFILIENQYNVGDKVKIGNFEGTVIKITIRSTVLQDSEGRVLYVSNGSISNVINYSNKKLSDGI